MPDIALMLERTSAGSINPDETLIYDNVSYVNGAVSYNPVTGIVTFSETGRFVAVWWVTVQSTLAQNAAAFRFETSEGVSLIGNSPAKPSEASGTAIFEVVEADATAQLVCESSSPVWLSPFVSVKASLALFQLNPATAGSGNAIIPYSSGDPVAVTSLLLGLAGLPAIVGFGNSMQLLDILGATISLLGVDNYAFSMPRDGFLTSLALYYSSDLTLNIPLGGSVNLRGEIYVSDTPNDTFSPTGVAVEIPITSNLAVGDTLNSIATGFSYPVFAQDRLLLVVSITTQGFSVATALTGYISAGLSIA